ncbi:transposase [Lactobacillus crispatus]|nr:transposase [Lactobacillus crispatus]
MNDFTKDFAQALFNPDKINDLFCQELKLSFNNIVETA